MLELSKPIPGVIPPLASLFAGTEAERPTVQRCEQCCTARFPAQEFCVNGLCGAGVRFEEELTLVSILVGLKPHEMTYGMASGVVFAKLRDQVTQPKFRPRNSA